LAAATISTVSSYIAFVAVTITTGRTEAATIILILIIATININVCSINNAAATKVSYRQLKVKDSRCDKIVIYEEENKWYNIKT